GAGGVVVPVPARPVAAPPTVSRATGPDTEPPAVPPTVSRAAGPDTAPPAAPLTVSRAAVQDAVTRTEPSRPAAELGAESSAGVVQRATGEAAFPEAVSVEPILGRRGAD